MHIYSHALIHTDTHTHTHRHTHKETHRHTHLAIDFICAYIDTNYIIKVKNEDKKIDWEAVPLSSLPI